MTSFLCPVVERCASAKSEHTSRRRFGNVSGSSGSGGMTTAGVADSARLVVAWAEGLREVADVERAETRLGMVVVMKRVN